MLLARRMPARSGWHPVQAQTANESRSLFVESLNSDCPGHLGRNGLDSPLNGGSRFGKFGSDRFICFTIDHRHEHPDGLRHHLVQLIRNSITWSKVFVHTELVLLVSHYPRPLRFEPPSEIARKHRGVSILASVIRNHTPAGAIAVRYRQHGYCSLTVFELSLHQMHSSGISHRHGIGTTQCGNGICRSWRMGQFFLETPKFGLAQEPPSSNRRRGALCWACF